MGQEAAAVVAQLAIAALLLGTGWWGRRRAHGLVPPSPYDDQARRDRVAVLRRGALACQLIGLLFAGAALAALV
ncbi:hypothetical protein ACWFR5_14495 [Streptomyces sp. NPDC055092]